MNPRTKKLCLATSFALAAFASLVVGRAADPARYLNPADFKEPIRVACVGDSITYGSGVADRERNCYPAILAQCLGEKFTVRNFGVSGATLLKNGDHPYWKTKAFKEAADFAPHAVIIKLGTNDTKPQNWARKDEFSADLRAMIAHFSALPTKPRIWLCYPVPVYEDKWGINEATVKGEVIPLIKKIAKEKQLRTIDLHAGMSNRKENFPDGVHPNAIGAAFMAQIICYELVDHDRQ